MKYVCLFLVSLWCACNTSNNDSIHAAAFKRFDNLMELSIKELDDTDSSSRTFRLRVTPMGDKTSEYLSVEQSFKMIYKADSCFFLQINDRFYYPQYVQNISSGISRSFDFVVEFPNINNYKNTRTEFVFQDKYFTNRYYSIQLM